MRRGRERRNEKSRKEKRGRRTKMGEVGRREEGKARKMNRKTWRLEEGRRKIEVTLFWSYLDPNVSNSDRFQKFRSNFSY
jgi:hypothetical protein